mgnify:CR=1 FL=1
MSIGYKITSKAKRSESIAVSQFSDDLKREEKLRKISERKPSVKEKSEKEVMMAKAAEFVDNGIPLEMVPEELRNHHFFKVGYDVAVRRKNAMQFIQKNSGRR